MENNSNKTQQFFSDVTKGTSENHKPRKSFEPWKFSNFVPSTIAESMEQAWSAYERYKCNFDDHISCSIPLFREVQLAKAIVIARHISEPRHRPKVLDIGGSEGTLLKVLDDLCPYKNDLHNLDPNPDMIISTLKGYTEVRPIPEAFLEGFDDVPAFNPSWQYDVINESMTFQFISKERGEFVGEVKRLLKPNGLFFTEQKFSDVSGVTYTQNELFKDRNFKSIYFDNSQITSKSEEVLSGMQSMQVDREDYRITLLEHFEHVSMYYKAGNFAGFVASDSLEAIQSVRKDLGLIGLDHKFI